MTRIIVTTVQGKILKSSMGGDGAFVFDQVQQGGSMIDFDGVLSHVCSPTVVCVEKDHVETRQ